MKNNGHSFSMLLILYIAVAACSNPSAEKMNSPELEPEPKPDQIVLIFEQSPGNTRYDWPGGSYSGMAPPFEVRYVDDQLMVQHLTPKLAPYNDTLLIHTTRDIVEVEHAYQGMDVLSYLFHNGDSVLFTYEGKKPIVKILNREVEEEALNYDLIKRENLIEKSFPGYVRTRRIFALRDSAFQEIEGYKEKFEASFRTGQEAAFREYKAERLWLDSLKEAGVLSGYAYKLYNFRADCEMKILQMDSYKGNHLEGMSDLEILSIEDTGQQEQELLHFLSSGSDSLGLTLSYHKILQHILRDYYGAMADWIITSNSKLRDYRQVYDAIVRNSQKSDQVRKILLFNTMDDLLEQVSIDDAQLYWAKFKVDVPEQAYIDYLNTKYELDTPISEELELADLSGEKANLSEILKQHEGRLVYVDFWASWCAPCIRAFPAADSLKAAYQGEDIVFLYISIDEDMEKWQKGADKHGITNNSWLVKNRRTSRMLEELDVSTIPRYLLYDREGKLVHKKAPGPGGEEIRKLLDRHLRQKAKAKPARASIFQ